ncbi:MAG: peptidylprolyl isomerase [Deltaproteobacteria bacterium]
MKRGLQLLILCVVLSSFTAFAEDNPVLAKIGDREIRMSDLDRIIGYYDQERQALIQKNPQQKLALLRRLVQGTVLSDAARKSGFDKDPSIKEQIDFIMNDFLATEYVRKEVLSRITVTEEDMKLYYQAHQEEFRTPESVKASHVLIRVNPGASDDEKKKAREKAEAALKRIKDGEDFAKVASEVSEDPGSKTKGGDLGFFSKGRMVKPFEDAAFALKPGQLSDVVESPFGFHVIKVEDKKEAAIEPYDAVKDKVREKVTADMRKAKVEEFIDKAMKDAKVELKPEALAPPPAPAP